MTGIRFEQLRSTVRGPIVQPGDEAYESTRKVYNGMIDKRPACIVQCTDVADVIAAGEGEALIPPLLTAFRDWKRDT